MGYLPYQLVGRISEPSTSMKESSHITPLKFNMEPENYGFQNESQSPFPGADFNVSC